MLLRHPGDKKALPQPSEHTDEEDLELYALCRLEERISEEIEIHLLGCEACRNRLLEIDQFFTAYRRLQELANCALSPAAIGTANLVVSGVPVPLTPFGPFVPVVR